MTDEMNKSDIRFRVQNGNGQVVCFDRGAVGFDSGAIYFPFIADIASSSANAYKCLMQTGDFPT